MRRLINSEPNLAVCGEASDPIEAARGVRPKGVDLAGDPLNGNGPAVIGRLKRSHPGLSVVVVSLRDGAVHGRRMREAGADVYLNKAEAAGRILLVIRGILKEL